MQLFNDERDWLTLMGQPESARIEFKSCRILGKKEKAIEELSQETSAFANTEGGVIFIGIEERKDGKSRIADRISGLSPDVVSPEWLQQVVESNISPSLPGIRVSRVHFTGENTGTVGFSIAIPQGSTAYQAKDMKYYGRSEFEKKPLIDNEIRLRMMKGRIAQAKLLIAKTVYNSAGMLNKNIQDENKTAIDEGRFHRKAKDMVDSDIFEIHMAVMNISDVTISDFILDICIKSPYIESKIQRHRFARPTLTYKGSGKDTTFLPSVIFPQDRVNFPSDAIAFHIPVGEAHVATESTISWTIFLDNSPPCKGVINVGEMIIKESLKAEHANQPDAE